MDPASDAVSDEISRDQQQEVRDQIWDELQRSLDYVYTHNCHLSKAQYMELYTHVYHYCNSAIRVKNPGSEGSRLVYGASCVGLELHERLGAFLEDHVYTRFAKGDDLIDEYFLRFFSKDWDEYKLSSRLLDAVFLYFNEHWVKIQWENGRKNVSRAFELALLAWKNAFFSALHRKVTSALLKLIQGEREGELVDRALLRNVVFCYVELGICEDGASIERPDLSAYKSTFELALLEDTEDVYNRESMRFLSQNTIPDYMSKVELCLSEEVRRVHAYMHDSTLEPLIKTCEKALIENYLDNFYTEFKNMLSGEDRDEDLGRMFRIVGRTSKGFPQLLVLFEEHVRAQGQSAVDRLGEPGTRDAITYVGALLQVHRRYNELLRAAFSGNADFAAHFDKACFSFMNDNSVTRAASSCRKTAELLAEYCDILLKNTSVCQNESQLEDALEEVLTVFKYLDDKDVFLKFYSKLLAARILQQLYVSDDVEAIMIYKLKLACGFEYVCGLQRMFQDVAVSKDVNDEFAKHMVSSNEALGLEFSIQVLTSGSWPFQEPFTLMLPQELECSVQCFTQFYSARHNGRKLEWLHNLSKGQLVTGCFKKTYTLQASTLQMAVLLQYNFALSFSVKQLHEATAMEMNTLQQVLRSLLKSKLLLCTGHESSSSGNGELHPEDTLSLFEDYSHKKPRVNINEPFKTELKGDHEATHSNVDVDRKLSIQAAIVRIMKIRKTLEHQQLIAEVLEQLSSRFTPRPLVIKQCIDILLDKEYLKRTEGQSDTYSYVA